MKTIFPIIFIIISIGVFFVFVNPLYNDISGLRSDVAAYNQALSNSTNLEKTRDALLQKYNQVAGTDKDRLDHLLPNTVDNIGLILEIQKIAQAHSMPLKNIRFDAPKPDQPQNGATISANNTKPSLPYGIFNLNFTTDGNYDTFVSFLNDLEHNLRLINIKTVSFSVPSAPSASSKNAASFNPDSYTYSVQIETYWLKN